MTKILITYISFSHLFEFTFSYFLLDQLYLKSKKNYGFIALIFLFGLYIGKNFTNLDTLILFVFFFFLSLKNATKKNGARTLLIVSVAYFIEVLISQLMKPLFLKSLETSQLTEQVLLFFLILTTTFLFIAIVSWGLNKWFFPKIDSRKKEITSAYLLTFCLLAYQTYWLLVHYANSMPLLQGFILVFYTILFASILLIIQTLTKNEELKFQAKQRKLEYDMMNRYAEEVKKQYQDIRKFQHDYVNILSSVEYYLDSNKIDELKKFYYTNVKQTKTLFKTNMLRLDDLQKIDSLEIKSILTTKLITAQEKKINVQIEVLEQIPDDLVVDPIILIRILGILLDNAIEELEYLQKGQLLVGLFIINNDLLIMIQNTVRENIEPIHVLKQEGYSTKGDKRGIGLTNVSELIVLERQLLLETTITNEAFVQKITITRG